MSEKKELKALYSGKLPIGSLELDCYVLNDDKNTRILSNDSIFKAFDRPRKGIYKEQGNYYEDENGNCTKLPTFCSAKCLFPYINKEFLDCTKLITFQDGDKEKVGYKAEILPEVCNLYILARKDNKLTKSQIKIANQASIILAALAKVGITALIDEATGFQYDRKNDALRYLLQQYIAEGLQKWIKTFPDDLFTELDRLYENEKTTSRQRPQYYGKFINTYIYEPLEDGYIKNALDEKNIRDDGTKKARFHQWLTQFGREQLTKQIWKVLGAMQAASDLENAKFLLAKQAGMTTFSKDLFETKEVIVKPQKKQKIKEENNIKTEDIIKDNQELEYKDNIEKKTRDIDFINNIKQAQLDLPENDKPEDIIAPFTREFKKK